MTGKKNVKKIIYEKTNFNGSNLREIIQFLREIECIEFECNEFVLVLVQIDLIHFEHKICISSTWIKTNTNPLVQLQLKQGFPVSPYHSLTLLSFVVTGKLI